MDLEDDEMWIATDTKADADGNRSEELKKWRKRKMETGMKFESHLIV